jgi:hypothetical protein
MDLLLFRVVWELCSGVWYWSWPGLRVFLGNRNGQEKERKGMDRPGLSQWCTSLLPSRRRMVPALSQFLVEHLLRMYLYISSSFLFFLLHNLSVGGSLCSFIPCPFWASLLLLLSPGQPRVWSPSSIICFDSPVHICSAHMPDCSWEFLDLANQGRSDRFCVSGGPFVAVPFFCRNKIPGAKHNVPTPHQNNI